MKQLTLLPEEEEEEPKEEAKDLPVMPMFVIKRARRSGHHAHR